MPNKLAAQCITHDCIKSLSRFETMKIRHLTRLLLFWSTLYLQTPETNSKASPEFLEKKRSTLQIKPKITVSVILGNATELQCRNENRSSEGKHYIHILPLSLLLRMSFRLLKKCLKYYKLYKLYKLYTYIYK